MKIRTLKLFHSSFETSKKEIALAAATNPSKISSFMMNFSVKTIKRTKS